MNRRPLFSVLIGILIFSLSIPSSISAKFADDKNIHALHQSSSAITVGSFSFDVLTLQQSPTFSEDFHLGSTGDGRDWLVIRMMVTNLTSENQRIHSDQVRLVSGEERIKQTGQESQSVADSLGIMNIGGPSKHTINANEDFEFIQVYKIDPAANDLSLLFDFSGEWTLPIDPSQIVRGGSESVEADSSWTIQTENYRLTLVGATRAPIFSGPYFLGHHSGGMDWVVVSWKVENSNAVEFDPDGADFKIIAGGEEIKLSAETDGVASWTGMNNPGAKIPAHSSSLSVAVYEVDQDTTDIALQVQSTGTWYIDLTPAIAASDGDPEVVIEESQLNLAEIYVDDTSTAFVPTPAPTPIPAPTSIPEPTSPPVYGSEHNPAGLYEAIIVGGFTVSLDGVQLADSLNFGLDYPAGGFRFLLISVTVSRTGDTGGDVGPTDFSIINLDTGKSYGTNFYTLDNVDLAPGEYTYGQVAFEVPVSGTNFQVVFRPSLFGDAGYWNFALLLRSPADMIVSSPSQQRTSNSQLRRRN